MFGSNDNEIVEMKKTAFKCVLCGLHHREKEEEQ